MNILRRTDSEILEHYEFLFLLNASQASCFLLLMSSVVPSKLPKYLLFFQLWSDVLLMLYSSVLSALTIRFLFVRIFGTVFFITSLASRLVVTSMQETSSSCCCSIRYAFFTLLTFYNFLYSYDHV